MNRRPMNRVLGYGLVMITGTAVASVPPAAAFPGETAQEMIARHGAPSLPDTIPLPSRALLQSGRPASVLVVWFHTAYRPLALPMEMEGRVIVSFRFDEPALLKRMERGESNFVWSDLRSDFESLFTSLSTEQFERFLTMLEKNWLITKTTHHAEPPYALYEAVSRDGTLKAEFSFRTPGVPSPSAKDPYYGGKFPDGNVWIRVQRTAG